MATSTNIKSRRRTYNTKAERKAAREHRTWLTRSQLENLRGVKRLIKALDEMDSELGGEPKPENVDLCDICMSSGVETSHTQDGKTVCVECADQHYFC